MGWSLTGAEEVTYYGVSGQRMGTYGFIAYADASGGHLELTVQTMSAYFGSRLIRKGVNNGAGQMSWTWVLPNRLGSVGVYYPYGEDRGGSNPGNGTDKFATYFRDSESGLDYAVNRYYFPAGGRFMSPDPYRASAGAEDPSSWNRYGYVRGRARLNPGCVCERHYDDPEWVRRVRHGYALRVALRKYSGGSGGR